MGWFAIACICGFAGYWYGRSLPASRAGWYALGAAIILFVFCIWAIWEQAVSHGWFARFLLGLVFGIGAAFTIRQRSGPEKLLPTQLVLPTGLVIVILALIAPYVDGWLQRLSGLKSPFIEVQLAGSDTHRISVADGIAIISGLPGLDYLKGYHTRIKMDIQYFQQYEKGEPINKLQNLEHVFESDVSPIATCILEAIKAGWLTVDGARRMLDPAADVLEQIIFAEDYLRKGEKPKLDDWHTQFWQKLTAVPGKIVADVSIPQCENYKPSDLKTFPKFQDYSDLPYLHAAAAAFIGFTGDSATALRILQNADDLRKNKKGLQFKDYTFLYLLGRLNYYEGKRVDVASYFDPLNDLHAMARRRVQTLEAGKEKCGADDSPLCFAQIYQLVAENLTAYYLAEDLARGNDYAKSYRATIAEYTERIKRIVDDSDTRDSVLGRLRSYLLPLPDGNNQFDAYISSDKDGFLDTYAFATLALEATKPMPDYDRIKREVSDVLKRVVERNRRHLTDALKDGDSSAIVRLASALKTAQSHLTSAQGLIGE